MAIDQAQDAQHAQRRQELLPTIVDHLSGSKPDALYAEYPVSPWTYNEGYRQITYRDFANAINGVAWWLQKTLGQGNNREVLTYMGPNDIRYPALVLGAAKAGYVIFLSSPRNSVTGQIDLLNRLKCTTILSPNPQPPPITAILEARKMRMIQVPDVGDLLDKQWPPFPYDKTYEEAYSEPLFAVHTSGSTGLPKPLLFTHETAATNITMMSLDPPPEWENLHAKCQGKRVFLTFPPFHGAYLACHLFNAIPSGAVMIAPISGAIATAKGLVEGLTKTSADVAFLVPSIVEDLSQNPDLLDYCAANLERIVYCGGSLPQAAGDTVAMKIPLLNQFGASELGVTTLVRPKGTWDQGDWKHICFHPDLGIELRRKGDETYELYVVRSLDLKNQQPTFTLFPDLQTYSSRDLFVRHPSKDDFWEWCARADDIIVFLNGEKTNPVSMEQDVVSRIPEVTGALVVGTQRFQAALLLELVESEKQFRPSDRATLIEKFWPIINQLNQLSPAHARVAKSHIVFTHPQKRMLRAGKGTIQRAATVSLYEKEIDDLYANADTLAIDHDISKYSGSLDDASAVAQFIKSIILSVTDWTEFADTDNFFTMGMDSLQALTATRKFKQSQTMNMIELSIIYTNPSVSELTDVVLRFSNQRSISEASEEQARQKNRSDLLQEYQALIDKIPLSPPSSKKAQSHKVILTGSTGALGSYILNALLAELEVAKVYCLNRAPDGLLLQKKRNKIRGLPIQLDLNRVAFLTADLSQTYFGLPFQAYNELLNETTHIIHAAWPVDFNLSITSFRPQFMGLINLVEFTSRATFSPEFLFISSISSVLSNRTASLRTPEEVVKSDSSFGMNGYAESKYVAERLLDYSIQRLPIRLSFARVGQIAGAVKFDGLWNRSEWFPSLVTSSDHIGLIPKSLDSFLDKIDWVPIDLLAEILVELAFSRHLREPNLDSGDTSGELRVWHPLNPHPTTWNTIKTVITDELKSRSPRPVETVSLSEWIREIRSDAEKNIGPQATMKTGMIETYLALNPAVKLLDFYESLLFDKSERNELETVNTVANSERLRALGEIKTEWVQKWIKELFQDLAHVVSS